MEIPCKQIAHIIEEQLKQEVVELTHKGKTPKLATILVGDAIEQISYVKIKQRVAKTLGIGFEFTHLEKIPADDFLQLLKEKSQDPSITGMIVQLPLPDSYDIQQVYNQISYIKEIEGHKHGSVFQFPLSLAVLTGLKYLVNGNKLDQSLIVNFPEDTDFFYTHLKDKKIIIAGRGETGGKPIADALTAIGLSYRVTHSQTQVPEQVYKEADIIITATGRKILSPEMIKPGAALLNVGLRAERGFLKGDYDEKEIEHVAGYHTKTPGGLGPIDVLYLYKNLVDATKTQIEKNIAL